MSLSRKIFWIDDDGRRKRTADDIGADFINVNEEDLGKKVDELLKRPQPSLIVLDHILDKTAGTNPFFKKGSTIAEALKEQWSTCPVVGITNADIDTIDLRTQRTYDELFAFSHFREYIETIGAIRRGFATVARFDPRGPKDLLSLLKPPDDEIDRLLSALPEELKNSFRDPSVASNLYTWVEKLINRPGFLYDSLWVATLIGLNEKGFEKVSEHFDKALYRGVFSVDDNPRWWSSLLTVLLYKRCSPEPGEFSWNVGRRLAGVATRFYSHCYVCDEKDPPEVVAYLDSQADERQPMHLKHTVLHPGFKRELFFEDIRMMED
jgi:hypothetical protein